MFTPDELAELKAYDEMVEKEPLTMSEIIECRERDKEAVLAEKDNRAKARSAYRRAEGKKNRTAYHAAYYKANKEAIRERKRKYREENRERINEDRRAYYAANREAIRAYEREWYAKKKGKA